MKISVIGCGYLGAVHAATLASMGHTVVGIDTDAAKVDHLSRGFAPFYEPGLEELLKDGRQAGTLTFSTDMAAAAQCQVHFLCVGTPQSKTSDTADLSYLVSATEALLPNLGPGAVVIGKSTVPVGTVNMIAALLNGWADVSVGWNPEFLRQGTAVKDSLVPDRLVYGAEGDSAARVTEVLDAVYSPLLAAGVPRIVCNFATAELIKSAANAFLATKVSFINAMAQLCDASGADVTQMSAAMGLDPRIGSRYLQAGLGFGGGCLPKDIRSFQSQARALSVPSVDEWMALVDGINKDQRSRSVLLAQSLVGGVLAGRRVTVLGAAFKPDTDDIRDSPALDLALQLAESGAQVTVTDPKAINNAWMRYPQLQFENSVEAALEGAELVVLATEWAQYRELSPLVAASLVSRQLLLDTRNALDADAWRRAGWTVRCLGIGATVPAEPGVSSDLGLPAQLLSDSSVGLPGN
ncbi:UDP-glucose dehydrogenase family protein [Pseudarthrobacter sp. J1738]|uniref:UDP-glucose dehydrogenase family protein n=1 Tax=Pseudarthrobacter sp. J1738 TaxID=3420446 RepID=UPI003D26D609